MTKKLTEKEKKARIDFKKLNGGILAGAIIESFETRYPSMRIFDEKEITIEFSGKYQKKLHVYAMGFKDAIRWLVRLRKELK